MQTKNVFKFTEFEIHVIVSYNLSVLMKVLRLLARLVSVAFPPNPTTRAVSNALLPPAIEKCGS